MNTVKSMFNILLPLSDESLGGASLSSIINLDKLLWQYHKEVAEERKLDVDRGGWFQKLTRLKPMHGYMRDAVDVIKDYAKARPAELTYLAEEILEDEYYAIMLRFVTFLSDKIPAKGLTPTILNQETQ